MKALDKIRDRAAGRRNARLTTRIAQAAELYPEPGNPRDWYQVTVNADRELTEARKDAAHWREQMLKDAPGSEAREQHWWDMKEAEDTMRNIEIDRAIELDAALAYDAREDEALQDAIEAGKRFPDKIGHERDWLIVPESGRDTADYMRIAQAREELIAEDDRVDRLALRSRLKEAEWELAERREFFSDQELDEYQAEETPSWLIVSDAPATDPYPEDYYTQRVGSERHRAAYVSYWEAHRGPDFGRTLDEEYYSDHYPEIQIERAERQRMQECDRMPAVDENGNKYFANGQIVAEGGREIAPPYTPEQWAALEDPQSLTPEEWDATFPPYPPGPWDEAHPSKFTGPVIEGPELPPDWPETDLPYVTAEDAERDAARAAQNERDAVKAHDAEHEDDIRPHDYVYDGTGPEECTFMEDNGWKCAQPKEGHPKAEAEQAQRLP